MSRADDVASPRLTRRVVEIPPGSTLSLDAVPGPDAIVFVVAGAVDVACASGTARFGTGAVLCFTHIAVRALRNPGDEPVRLLVVSRSANRTG